MNERAAAERDTPSLALLGAVSSLSPFGMAVVLPIVGTLATRFDTSLANAQFVVSAYLLGLGLMQPFSGVFADRFGRRPVLLAGTAVFASASVGCLLATSFPMLVLMRFLQAVGISVGTVATRAIVRDTHESGAAAAALSRLAAMMGVAPMIAPVLGGLVGSRFGPQSVFLLTAVLAMGALAWMATHLNETRVSSDGPSTERWWQGYGRLFGSRSFIGNTLIYGLLQGSFFAFLAVGAEVFAAGLGLGPDVFGIVWGALSIVYVVGAIAAGRLSARLGKHGVLRIGTLIVAVSAGLLAGNVTLLGLTLGRLLLPLLGMMVANGLMSPMALAGAVAGRPQDAGKAAGLSSAIGLVLSGSFSIVAGNLYAPDFLVISWLMAGAIGLATLCLPWATRT